MGKWRPPGSRAGSDAVDGSRLRRFGRRLADRLRRGRAEPIPDEATVTFLPAHGGPAVVVRADTGTTLLAIARANGLDVSSYCGGQCSCGTCRVGVDGGPRSLTPRTPNEAMVLGESQVRAGERLACQARLLGDVKVALRDLF